MSEKLSDYTEEVETWWLLKEEEKLCPECGSRVSTNGRVYRCTGRYELTTHECGWWEKR